MSGGMAGRRVTRFSIRNTGTITILCSAASLSCAAWADDNCASSTYRVTCSGNQSTGVRDTKKNVVDKKDVVIQSLNTDITPGLGIVGVYHYAGAGSDITQIKVGADLGAYSINTAGDWATGIKLGGDGSENSSGSHDLEHVILSFDGNISTVANYGYGIWAFSKGGDGKSNGNGAPAMANFDIGLTTGTTGQIHTDRTAAGARGIYINGSGGVGDTGATGSHGGNGGEGPGFLHDGATLIDGTVSSTGGLFNQGQVNILTEGNGQIGNGTGVDPDYGAEGVYINGLGGAGAKGGQSYFLSDGPRGGNGGNASKGDQPWQIGQFDLGSWNVETRGSYAAAYRFIGQGGIAGTGGHADGVGGHGGTGGNGASMNLWYGAGQVIGTTSGQYAPGLWVMSEGGKGGNGGGGSSGGSGYTGGNGGFVNLGGGGRQFYMTTHGNTSPGIHIHTQGGDGGNGTGGDPGSGGNGGGGGKGGNIATGTAIWSNTSGDYSDAFAAYSTGGGGGKAGDGSWAGISGSGGDAASGGDIDVNLWGGQLTTKGYGSDALVAQSIGGHAGDTGNCGGLVCFGANGGSAGNGGNVSVELTSGSITLDTQGDRASGILALSVGGGGGDGGGGFAAFYAEGSKGGKGGNGGEVYVTSSAKITTAGNDSKGIDAKSVGGAGGNGFAAEALGAFGARQGGSADAGKVTVYNWNRIVTGTSAAPGTSDDPVYGDDPICGVGCSYGIFAQSIGGGGGHAGTSGGVFTSVGGSGSSGGDGGEVFVQTYASGSITTYLEDSDAIYAHSIGGGGGKAGGTVSVAPGVGVTVGGEGSKGGKGGKVTVKLYDEAGLNTFGDASAGIDAMSVGGGGGEAGYTMTFSASGYAGGAVAVGRGGGGGGNAGDVTVLTDTDNGYMPSITTRGEQSPGIDAQSTGGKGGKGGYAISAEVGSSYISGSAAVGGDGGGGGNGGTVAVTSNASISTQGDDSYGIWAKSHGGGGGVGGFAIAADVNVGDGATVGISIGGSGGDGGVGGEVDVTSTGAIGTKGDNAHGVFAHSVGGGGGSGGMAISGSINAGGGEAGGGSINVAIGGSGGEGGTGGPTTVKNSKPITTTGEGARGIFAQSVGGGGGTGGLAFSGGAQIANKNSAAVNFALGGSGGKGGNGGVVEVDNSASITTGLSAAPAGSDGTEADKLTNAHAIFAQSVGKGGGDGWFAGTADLGVGGGKYNLSVGIALGGKGGGAGGGRDVTVISAAGTVLTTYYDDSVGIMAQSVGGGGGRGGSSFSGTQEIGEDSDGASVIFNFAHGGTGGVGNQGGTVTVNNDSRIETWGDHAHGIFAQSVGAGGGAGGSADTYVSNLKCNQGVGTITEGCSSYKNVEAAVALGGNGGDSSQEDSEGGEVDITSTGKITTRGGNSTAIYAQSVGGGGGDGGHGVAGGFPLPKVDRSKFLTSWNAGVGGSGGVAGRGQKVSVDHTVGTLITDGANSSGIFAQSVGGGGGRGGSGGSGLTGKISIGGAGGAAGDGGNVTLAVSIADPVGITTGSPPSAMLGDDDDDTLAVPDASYGVFAQSVGGGGGVSGGLCLFDGCWPDSIFGIDNPIPKANIGVGYSYLQPGGNGGDGGIVDVTVDANVTTYADGAIGILAQSIGGGGGVAGDAGLVNSNIQANGNLIGSVGGGGAGGPVTVAYTGDLVTYGGAATGIFAQSAGGDGAKTPYGADVNVTVTGSVTAWGENSNGIFVQSVKYGEDTVTYDSNGVPIGPGTLTAGGSSHVVVNKGSSVQGGLPGNDFTGAGVEFHDGLENTLQNDGMITTLNPDGIAVVHTGLGTLDPDTFGSTAVTNTGLIVGDFRLPNAKSRVRNTARGQIFIGPKTVVGGALGRLRNDGRISIVGDRIFGTSEIDARFVQGKSGILAFDLEHRQDLDAETRTDRLILRQDARIGGVIDVNIRDAGGAGLGRHEVTLIEADKNLDTKSLRIKPSAVAQYRLQRAAKSLALSYDIDFLNPAVRRGLGDNQTEIAAHLVDLHGSGNFAPELLYLTEAEDADAYGAELDALSPAPYGVSGSASLMSSLQFGDSLMSCRERGGEYRFIREADCLRLDFGGREYSQDGSSETAGYDVSWGGFSIGGQKAVSEEWIVGMGLAYGSLNASSDGGLWRSDGDQFQLGVVAKRQVGATLFAASVSGGFGDADVRRNAAPGLTADGNQDFRYVSGQLRAVYAFERGDWYVKPRVDLNATYVDTGDVTESGAGAANLVVEGSDDVYWALRPAVEIGGEVDAGSGYLVRPRVAIGITQYLNDPSQTVTARLRDAGPDGGSFTVENAMDWTAFDVGLGVDILSETGVQVSIGALAQVGENATSYGGGVRLAIPF
jgi:hypothetical protein